MLGYILRNFEAGKVINKNFLSPNIIRNRLSSILRHSGSIKLRKMETVKIHNQLTARGNQYPVVFV